jgi:hypothetical protein
MVAKVTTENHRQANATQNNYLKKDSEEYGTLVYIYKNFPKHLGKINIITPS